MVAKTVATSNLANAIAASFKEEVFEPPVGFKEFKPVMGKALVFFEESDGISIIGHTPEKDAYIGLLLAMDIILTLQKNLGDYLEIIENQYGTYYPDRDGVAVSQKGDELIATPINLGSDFLISINDLVSMAEKIGGVTLKRTHNLDAPTGVAGRNSDNTFIQKMLGWAPSLPLEEGMKRTYSWIEKQYADRKAGKRTVS